MDTKKRFTIAVSGSNIISIPIAASAVDLASQLEESMAVWLLSGFLGAIAAVFIFSMSRAYNAGLAGKVNQPLWDQQLALTLAIILVLVSAATLALLGPSVLPGILGWSCGLILGARLGAV